MRRFFIEGELTDTITITGQDAHHISRVLRMAVGDEIIVAGKGGQACRARLHSINPDEVIAEYIEPISDKSEPPVEVWLAQGLPKSDKMDFIVQKAVEIGAAGVIPMAVDFGTVQYDDAKKKSRVERWQKIAHEAAKQCGRDVVPTVKPVQSLAQVLSGLTPRTIAVMLYENPTGDNLRHVLTTYPADSYLILIGPEGGFSQAEVKLCREKGVHIATLGPRILRTETASLAALSIVLYEKGDLG